MIFGIGTDLIENHRIKEKLERTPGLKEKLFTEIEIKYCETKKQPYLHYAARFAGKEAFLKAMGTGFANGYKFNEIEILNDEKGKPFVKVYGKVKEFLKENKILSVQISMAHIKEFAKAVVILEKKEE